PSVFMTRHRNGHRHGQHPNQTGTRPLDAFLPWLVDESIPALVSPLRTHSAAGDPANPPPATWAIVQLNRSVLEKEVFPELTHKYLRGATGLDYHVAILAGGAGRERVLYSSDSHFAERSDLTPDAALNLFGPPFHRTPTAGQGPDQISVTVRAPRSKTTDDH